MKKIAYLLPTIAVSASIVASPASAQAANRDVHCLILSNFFSQAANGDAQKKAASEAGLFFLGRLDGKLAGAQLVAAIAAEGKSIKGDTAGAEMGQCLKTLQASGAAMQAAMTEVRQKTGK